MKSKLLPLCAALCMTALFTCMAQAQQNIYRITAGKAKLPEIQAGTAYSGVTTNEDAGDVPAETGDGEATEEVISDDEESEPETDAEPITWSHRVNTWGDYGNYNTTAEAMMAVDGDLSTRSDTFLATNGGAIRAFYDADHPFSGTVTVHWRHGVGNGYNNTGKFNVTCMVNGAWVTLFANSAMYSNNSYTPATTSGYVQNCTTVAVYASDIGKGFVFFDIYEIEVNQD